MLRFMVESLVAHIHELSISIGHMGYRVHVHAIPLHTYLQMYMYMYIFFLENFESFDTTYRLTTTGLRKTCRFSKLSSLVMFKIHGNGCKFTHQREGNMAGQDKVREHEHGILHTNTKTVSKLC